MLLTLSFSIAAVQYFREVKVTDFYEIMSLYHNYAERHNVISLYNTGLAITALGISQGVAEVTNTGLSYIGNGLLNQLNFIQSPYEKKFTDYKKQMSAVKSREESEELSRKAVSELITQEQTDQKINGAVIGVNGGLLSMSPKSSLVGFVTLLLAGYIAFFEKGPLEQMVGDYNILDKPVSLNMDQLDFSKIPSANQN